MTEQLRDYVERAGAEIGDHRRHLQNLRRAFRRVKVKHVAAHAQSDEEAKPDGAAHQECSRPFLEQCMTEAGDEPRCNSDQPCRTWSWLNFVRLDVSSLNQNNSSEKSKVDD